MITIHDDVSRGNIQQIFNKTKKIIQTSALRKRNLFYKMLKEIACTPTQYIKLKVGYLNVNGNGIILGTSIINIVVFLGHPSIFSISFSSFDVYLLPLLLLLTFVCSLTLNVGRNLHMYKIM